MMYVRMFTNIEDGEPSVSLYEMDDDGHVYRQAQVHANGSRFAPEDMLLSHALNVGHIMTHPASEEISEEDFDLIWIELDAERPFRRRIPDPEQNWSGILEHRERNYELVWLAMGRLDEEWTLVPGFMCLYVRGPMTHAWSMHKAVFLELPIQWQAFSLAA